MLTFLVVNFASGFMLRCIWVLRVWVESGIMEVFKILTRLCLSKRFLLQFLWHFYELFEIYHWFFQIILSYNEQFTVSDWNPSFISVLFHSSKLYLKTCNIFHLIYIPLLVFLHKSFPRLTHISYFWNIFRICIE